MRQQLLENLLFFLERPSVTGSEKLLCDDLAARISSSQGWEIERISNNLAIRRNEQDPSRPRIVLAGHLDTVPEPEGGLEVRVEGDSVYGRGASDMKSGDAVMLALLEGVSWEESRFEPVFVFYEREEGLYAENGLEAVFAGSPWVLDAELALVPEPTAAALEVGCVGTAHVEVTFSGTSAHAARAWQGPRRRQEPLRGTTRWERDLRGRGLRPERTRKPGESAAARAHTDGPGGASQAGLDRRGPLLRARGRGGELRPRAAFTGAPEDRVRRASAARRVLRAPRIVLQHFSTFRLTPSLVSTLRPSDFAFSKSVRACECRNADQRPTGRVLKC